MIKGNVVGQKLCADFPYIVGGSIDYLTAEFTFSDEWKGLDIWAHFSHGGTTYDIRLKDGKIEREDHLNLSDGHWHLYLHGTKEGMRITTNEVLFVVDESGAINGEPLPEIPLSAAEQIALDASDAREIAASVRKDADDGVFDGKPFTYEDFTPEQLAGLKGETGDTGATGVGVLSVEQTVKSNEDDGENQFEITLTNGDTYTFGVKNGSKGSTGETGATGATGETGVGIKSVEQTVVSTEDDGVNVFTITLTNDEQYTVEVRNGSKGIQGDKGDTGVGIESVKQTSTSTEDDGENVVTVRLTNGVEETLTFKNGSKGSQGIQGVQGVQGIQGESGKDGASVTVSNVSESTADGGNNIVTFSDGKTLTVKNGSKGSKGDTGEVDYSRLNGYLPLSGGTMTGAIALPNNIALKSKNNAGVEQEMIRANGSNQIVIGANGLWELLVLHHGIVPATSAVDTLDVGKADRRWRNLYISGVLSDGTNRITIANIANKSDIPSSLPASDVYAWAKAESKPTYTASEVGARPNTWTPSASEVGAAASSHNQAASTITAGTFAGQVVANSSGQAAGTSLLRNSKLVSAETNPTVNGEICWTYG